MFGSLLKKLRKKNVVVKTSEDVVASDAVWKHEEPPVQKSREEETERRTLRRQNRFLGFHNDLLALQNRRLTNEKHHLKMEKKAATEKKNEMARKLRKQKTISDYYRRQLAEAHKKLADQQRLPTVAEEPEDTC